MKQSPKVFVVDSHPAVLGSIETILGAQNYDVESCLSTEEFVAVHRPTDVGCVVIDLAIRGPSGRELIRRLHETRSLLSVVIISGLIDDEIRDRPWQTTARVFVGSCELWVFLSMIEDAVTSSLNRQHGKVQSSSSHSESPSHSGVDAHVKQLVLRLSPRQREVLSLLLMGHTSKDVADKLNMSEVTAGNHVQRIFKNFSVSTRSALMALFVRDSEE